MADRPIIFSAPMIRALLAGRKTMTRRVLRDVPAEPVANCSPRHEQKHPRPYLDAYCSEKKTKSNPHGMSDRWCWWQVDDRQCLPTFRVPYVPGDRLWVREAHAISANPDLPIWYRAGHEEAAAAGPRVDVKWRPSIHMPRWASRLTLIVEGVKVERLQDISGEDARAEGAEWVNPPCSSVGMTSEDVETLGYQIGFWEIWCSIHGEDAWNKNPWVVAISFCVVKANIDALDLANRPLVCEEATP